MSTTLQCAECVDRRDDQAVLSPAFYCSKVCQKSHWSQHKLLCKTVNATTRLYRAGELLQRMFYDFRRAAFDFDITRAEPQEGGKLAIYQPDYSSDHASLYRFPGHLINDPQDQKSLLAHLSCNEPPGLLLQLITKLMSCMSCPNRADEVLR